MNSVHGMSSQLSSSIDRWYDSFKRLTIKSKIIYVTGDILEYLNEDGVVLPVEATTGYTAPAPFWLDTNYEDESQNVTSTCKEKSEENQDEAKREVKKPLSFPEFSLQLEWAMSRLGGKVFIKGNWSAPLDASWILANKNLMCTSLEDIYLLLKSSSRLIENLNSLKDKKDCCIVLKKWQDIHHGTEFRCFVHKKALIGISQRHCSEYFKYITEAHSEIIADIKEFFHWHIKNAYPESNYTFDVVRRSSGSVILVDFGTFNDNNSQSLLFTWDALLEIGNAATVADQPEFRYISSTIGIQPPSGFTGFCAPFDLTPESMQSREVIEDLIRLFEEEPKTDN